MKYITIILSLFLLTSCGLLKKVMHTEKHEQDSVSVHKSDTLSVKKTDSVTNRESNSQNVNEWEISFDTAQGEVVDTLKIPISPNDYFYLPVKQKIKSVKGKSSQEIKLLEHAAITKIEVQKGSHSDSTATKKKDEVTDKKVERTGLFIWLLSQWWFWLLLLLLLIAGRCAWKNRSKIKGGIIHLITGV